MNSTPRKWISRFAVIAIALGSTFAMVAQDADAARRFGGGKSFGRQSSNLNKQATPPNAAAAPAQAAPGAAQQPQRNRWLGPLAGIAAGLGLAALFSHLGLSEGFGSILMIALLAMAAMFAWRMFRRSQATPSQPRQEPVYAGASPSPAPSEFSAQAPLPGGASNSVMSSFAGAATWGIPADFDKEGFARSAKVHFIRLQAAWDAKELTDIREFTTPEMYAEIKMQLSELKSEKTQTEVVDLEAEVLGVETSTSDDLASVRLKGTIREAEGAVAEPFQEVWNLSKPKNGRTGWLLAGVQQIQ
ncbi:MAG: Tim44 domain-containing protein [Burkholderiales bacterium]